MATDAQNLPNDVFKRYDDLKTLLRGHQNDKRDESLYKHLSKLMCHIVQHCPSDALNKLEEISYLIKLGDEAKLDSFLKRCQVNLYSQPSDQGAIDTTSAVIDKAQACFKVSVDHVR